MTDFRLENPSTFLISGPSQSGKTTFVVKLILNGSNLFKSPRCLQNILFFVDKLTEGAAGNFTSGDEYTIFTTNNSGGFRPDIHAVKLMK